MAVASAFTAQAYFLESDIWFALMGLTVILSELFFLVNLKSGLIHAKVWETIVISIGKLFVGLGSMVYLASLSILLYFQASSGAKLSTLGIISIVFFIATFCIAGLYGILWHATKQVENELEENAAS